MAEERRSSPRVGGPFPAVVLDLADCEQTLGVQATLDDIGAGGFLMRSAQRFGAGEKLLVVTKVSEAVVVLRGAVTRVDELEGGAYGVAVEIEKHQIFSLKNNPTQPQPGAAAADELLSPEA